MQKEQVWILMRIERSIEHILAATSTLEIAERMKKAYDYLQPGETTVIIAMLLDELKVKIQVVNLPFENPSIIQHTES